VPARRGRRVRTSGTVACHSQESAKAARDSPPGPHSVAHAHSNSHFFKRYLVSNLSPHPCSVRGTRDTAARDMHAEFRAATAHCGSPLPAACRCWLGQRVRLQAGA